MFKFIRKKLSKLSRRIRNFGRWRPRNSSILPMDQDIPVPARATCALLPPRPDGSRRTNGFTKAASMEPTCIENPVPANAQQLRRRPTQQEPSGARKKKLTGFWSNLFGSKASSEEDKDTSGGPTLRHSVSFESVNTILSSNSFSYVSPKKYKGKGAKGKRIPVDSSLERVNSAATTDRAGGRANKKKVGTLTRIGMRMGLKSKYNLQSCESLQNVSAVAPVADSKQQVPPEPSTFETASTLPMPVEIGPTPSTSSAPAVGTLGGTLRKKLKAPAVPEVLAEPTLIPAPVELHAVINSNDVSVDNAAAALQDVQEELQKNQQRKVNINNNPGPSGGTKSHIESSASYAAVGCEATCSSSSSKITSPVEPEPFKITAKHRRTVSEGFENGQNDHNKISTSYSLSSPSSAQMTNPSHNNTCSSSSTTFSYSPSATLYNCHTLTLNRCKSHVRGKRRAPPPPNPFEDSQQQLPQVQTSNLPISPLLHSKSAKPYNPFEEESDEEEEEDRRKPVVVACVPKKTCPATSEISSKPTTTSSAATPAQVPVPPLATAEEDDDIEQDYEACQNLLNARYELESHVLETDLDQVLDEITIDRSAAESELASDFRNGEGQERECINNSSVGASGGDAEMGKFKLGYSSKDKEQKNKKASSLARSSSVSKGKCSTSKRNVGDVCLTNSTFYGAFHEAGRSLPVSPSTSSTSTTTLEAPTCPQTPTGSAFSSLTVSSSNSSIASGAVSPTKLTPRPWYKRASPGSQSSKKSSKTLVTPVMCMTRFSDIDREASRIVAENKRRSAEVESNAAAKDLITTFNCAFRNGQREGHGGYSRSSTTTSVEQEPTASSSTSTANGSAASSASAQPYSGSQTASSTSSPPASKAKITSKQTAGREINGFSAVGATSLATSTQASNGSSAGQSNPSYSPNTKDWSCPRCTLLNSSWKLTCEACDYKKYHQSVSAETAVSSPATHVASRPTSASTSAPSTPVTSSNCTTTNATSCSNFLGSLPNGSAASSVNLLSDVPSKDKFSTDEKLSGLKLSDEPTDDTLDVERLREARLAFFDKNEPPKLENNVPVTNDLAHTRKRDSSKSKEVKPSNTEAAGSSKEKESKELNVFSDNEDDTIDRMLQIPSPKSGDKKLNVQLQPEKNDEDNNKLHFGNLQTQPDFSSGDHTGSKTWAPFQLNRFRPMLESILESNDVYQNVYQNWNFQNGPPPLDDLRLNGKPKKPVQGLARRHTFSSEKRQVVIGKDGKILPLPYVSNAKKKADKDRRQVGGAAAVVVESSTSNSDSSEYEARQRQNQRQERRKDEKPRQNGIVRSSPISKEGQKLTREDYRKLGAIPKDYGSHDEDDWHCRNDYLGNGPSYPESYASETDTASDASSLGFDTIAITKLLKQLEIAIARGDYQKAAALAHKLALLKVECVVSKGSNSPTHITIFVYVEDRFMQQGPFEVEISLIGTISDLKRKTELDWGIPYSFQKWILSKRVAEDETEPLKSFNLNQNSIAYLYLVTPQIDTSPETPEHLGEKSQPRAPPTTNLSDPSRPHLYSNEDSGSGSRSASKSQQRYHSSSITSTSTSSKSDSTTNDNNKSLSTITMPKSNLKSVSTSTSNLTAVAQTDTGDSEGLRSHHSIAVDTSRPLRTQGAQASSVTKNSCETQTEPSRKSILLRETKSTALQATLGSGLACSASLPNRTCALKPNLDSNNSNKLCPKATTSRSNSSSTTKNVQQKTLQPSCSTLENTKKPRCPTPPRSHSEDSNNSSDLDHHVATWSPKSDFRSPKSGSSGSVGTLGGAASSSDQSNSANSMDQNCVSYTSEPYPVPIKRTKKKKL